MSRKETNSNSGDERVQIRRRTKRKKVCQCCVDKIYAMDYKDTSRFKRFLTERGKIVPKRNSGTCAKHQRMLAEAIKRARFIGLIPICID